MNTKKIFPKFLIALLTLFVFSTKANAQCQANFTWTATGGTVQFTNTSISFNTPSCSWTFGDMSSTTGYGNMTHTYFNPGTYYVCLTINDTASMCTNTFCDSVTVSIGCLGLASTVTAIDESVANACDGSATASVTGGTSPYAFQWSNAANTTAISNLCVGNYSVVVTDANGCTANASGYVGTPLTCNANFNYSVSGNSVYLTNTSSDTMTSSFQWDFGDASFSSMVSPSVHNYASSGTYTIMLIMNNSFIGCTDTSWQTVTVGGPNSCGAAFSMMQDSLNPLQWYIYPSVSGQAPFSYLWDFGDTTTSTLAYPNHTYTYASHHIVCLTITDANLCTSVFCDSSAAHRSNASSGMQYVTVVNLAAGIQEQNEVTAKFYPNPATDELTVSFSKNVTGVIRITDLAGKTVYEKGFTSQQKQIDVSMLPLGIYSINIQGESLFWNQKIVIVR